MCRISQQSRGQSPGAVGLALWWRGDGAVILNEAVVEPR
jgi:hypothetical protein